MTASKNSSSVDSSFHSSSPNCASHAGDGVPGRDVLLGEHAWRLGMRAEDLDVFLRAGFDVADVPPAGANRRSMLLYLRKRETAPPKWVMISGLWPETELSDPADVRRKKIRALYKAAVLLIRRELKRFELDEFRAERTVFWDPVAEVCRELEISQSKLTGLCIPPMRNESWDVRDQSHKVLSMHPSLSRKDQFDSRCISARSVLHSEISDECVCL